MKTHFSLVFIATVSAASTIGCSGAPSDDATQTASEAVTESSGQSVLLSGQSLTVGQYLVSGKFKFIMQGDGNAVVYETGGHATWATGTNGKGGTSVYMNPDGNLQVRDGKTPIWQSGTNVPGSELVLSGDGSLGIHRPNGAPVWWTGVVSPDAVVGVIQTESRDHHVSGANLAGMVGVAACESGLDPTEVNASSGAEGLYQFLPSTWADLGGSGDPLDAADNAALAATWVGAHGFYPNSPWDGSWGIDPYLAWVVGTASDLPCYCRDALVNNGVSSIAGSGCY